MIQNTNEELRGLTAIVTGAGAQGTGVGNGRAAAVLLARSGARVALVDAHKERLQGTTDLIDEFGGEYLCLAGDVGREADCEAIVSATVAKWGRLDILVNNVGVAGPAESVVDIDIDDWETTFRVNVSSIMLMSRFAIPHMRREGKGSIVNVSSLAGLISHPRPTYAASKGAALSLTRSLASRHGPEGIRVNAVAPGPVYTPMVQAEGLTEEARAERAAMLPLRIEGTGWDVGEAVLFFAGPRARWITGVTLPVDGGFAADLRMTNATSVTPDSATASR